MAMGILCDFYHGRVHSDRWVFLSTGDLRPSDLGQ